MASIRYRAPTPLRTVQLKEKDNEMTCSTMFNDTWELIQHLIFIAIELPLTILNYIGIQIPSFCSPLFSVCVCGALTGVVCSTGIGLGVGIGVGLSCAKSYITNSTNSTFSNSSSSIITGSPNYTLILEPEDY
ncbi:hypothetical protein I4U23_003462 [Adineta vaga]|nr:hypothetical protein I4U23_003462 [Adineta vaga]